MTALCEQLREIANAIFYLDHCGQFRSSADKIAVNKLPAIIAKAKALESENAELREQVEALKIERDCWFGKWREVSGDEHGMG